MVPWWSLGCFSWTCSWVFCSIPTSQAGLVALASCQEKLQLLRSEPGQRQRWQQCLPPLISFLQRQAEPVALSKRQPPHPRLGLLGGLGTASCPPPPFPLSAGRGGSTKRPSWPPAQGAFCRRRLGGGGGRVTRLRGCSLLSLQVLAGHCIKKPFAFCAGLLLAPARPPAASCSCDTGQSCKTTMHIVGILAKWW